MRKKIVFIGNSIVAGYPWGKSKSFTGVLRRMLKDGVDGSGEPIAFAKDTGFDIINKGVNGDTTAGISARFEQDVLSHSPDMVFFHTAANDFIYREAGPEEAFANLESLAERAAKEGITSIYMTPVPVDAGKAEYMWLSGCGISYDAVNRDMKSFSEMLKGSGKLFIDINILYKDFVDEVGDVDLAYLDGVHPTPAGHEFIAKHVLNLIDKEELYK